MKERWVSELSQRRAARIDKSIGAIMDEHRILGAAVGLVLKGKIVYLAGYGLADRDKRTPVSQETLFRWASVSKPLTALAALQLAEQGRLQLHADVRCYVPEFPPQHIKKEPAVVTAHSLLCHQGGVVHYDTPGLVFQPPAPDNDDIIVALDTFKQSPLAHRPYTAYTYSTFGYILLSAVIERAGGQDF